MCIRDSNSLGEDDVRVSNRLYLPSRKLRGFESGKIGPVDGGDFVGGNYLAAFNAQSEIPIFESLETIDFNIFYDAAVFYTHLRAHETGRKLVCRLLLEKKKKNKLYTHTTEI